MQEITQARRQRRLRTLISALAGDGRRFEAHDWIVRAREAAAASTITNNAMGTAHAESEVRRSEERVKGREGERRKTMSSTSDLGFRGLSVPHSLCDAVGRVAGQRVCRRRNSDTSYQICGTKQSRQRGSWKRHVRDSDDNGCSPHVTQLHRVSHAREMQPC
jgi:hypothetical protein